MAYQNITEMDDKERKTSVATDSNEGSAQKQDSVAVNDESGNPSAPAWKKRMMAMYDPDVLRQDRMWNEKPEEKVEQEPLDFNANVEELPAMQKPDFGKMAGVQHDASETYQLPSSELQVAQQEEAWEKAVRPSREKMAIDQMRETPEDFYKFLKQFNPDMESYKSFKKNLEDDATAAGYLERVNQLQQGLQSKGRENGLNLPSKDWSTEDRIARYESDPEKYAQFMTNAYSVQDGEAVKNNTRLYKVDPSNADSHLYEDANGNRYNLGVGRDSAGDLTNAGQAVLESQMLEHYDDIEKVRREQGDKAADDLFLSGFVFPEGEEGEKQKALYKEAYNNYAGNKELEDFAQYTFSHLEDIMSEKQRKESRYQGDPNYTSDYTMTYDKDGNPSVHVDGHYNDIRDRKDWNPDYNSPEALNERLKNAMQSEGKAGDKNHPVGSESSARGQLVNSLVDKYVEIAKRRGVPVNQDAINAYRDSLEYTLMDMGTTQYHAKKIFPDSPFLQNAFKQVADIAGGLNETLLAKAQKAIDTGHPLTTYDALLEQGSKDLDMSRIENVTGILRGGLTMLTDFATCPFLKLPASFGMKLGNGIFDAGAQIVDKYMGKKLLAGAVNKEVASEVLSRAMLSDSNTARFFHSLLTESASGAATFSLYEGAQSCLDAIGKPVISENMTREAMRLQQVLGETKDASRWGYTPGKDDGVIDDIWRIVKPTLKSAGWGALSGAAFIGGAATNWIGRGRGFFWKGLNEGLRVGVNAATSTGVQMLEDKDNKFWKTFGQNLLTFGIYDARGIASRLKNYETITTAERHESMPEEYKALMKEKGIPTPRELVKQIASGKVTLPQPEYPGYGMQLTLFDKNKTPEQAQMDKEINGFLSNTEIPESIRALYFNILSGGYWHMSLPKSTGTIRRERNGDAYAVDLLDDFGNIIDTKYYKTQEAAIKGKESTENAITVGDLQDLTQNYINAQAAVRQQPYIEEEYSAIKSKVDRYNAAMRKMNRQGKKKLNRGEKKLVEEGLSQHEKDIVTLAEGDELMMSAKEHLRNGEEMTPEEIEVWNAGNRIFAEIRTNGTWEADFIAKFEKENGLKAGDLKRMQGGYDTKKEAKQESESGMVVQMGDKYYTLEEMQTLRDYRDSLIEETVDHYRRNANIFLEKVDADTEAAKAEGVDVNATSGEAESGAEGQPMLVVGSATAGAEERAFAEGQQLTGRDKMVAMRKHMAIKQELADALGVDINEVDAVISRGDVDPALSDLVDEYKVSDARRKGILSTVEAEKQRRNEPMIAEAQAQATENGQWCEVTLDDGSVAYVQKGRLTMTADGTVNMRDSDSVLYGKDANGQPVEIDSSKIRGVNNKTLDERIAEIQQANEAGVRNDMSPDFDSSVPTNVGDAIDIVRDGKAERVTVSKQNEDGTVEVTDHEGKKSTYRPEELQSMADGYLDMRIAEERRNEAQARTAAREEANKNGAVEEVGKNPQNVSGGAVAPEAQQAETPSGNAEAVPQQTEQTKKVEVPMAERGFSAEDRQALEKNGVNKKLIGLLHQAAQNLGLRIRLDDSLGNGTNGYVEGDTIVVNPNSRRSISFILGHEMTHDMQVLSPETYEAFKQLAVKRFRSVLSDEAYKMKKDAAVKRYREQIYTDKYKEAWKAGKTEQECMKIAEEARDKFSEADFEDELAANEAGNILEDKDYLEELVNPVEVDSQQPWALEKLGELKDFIMDYLRKIGNAIGWTVNKDTDFRELQTALTDLYRKSIKNNRGNQMQDAPRRYSLDTQAEAIGMVWEKDADGKSHFYEDKGNGERGREITQFMPIHIENSPMGAVLKQALKDGVITQEQFDATCKNQAAIMQIFKDTPNLDETFAVSGAIAANQLKPGQTTADLPAEMRDYYVMDKNGKVSFIPFKTNSETQYNTTWDATTICRKTQTAVDVMSETMKKLKRGLTPDEVIDIVYRNIYKESNGDVLVPCNVCYVFNRWVNLGTLFETMRNLRDMYPDTMSAQEINADRIQTLDKLTSICTGKMNKKQLNSYNKALKALAKAEEEGNEEKIISLRQEIEDKEYAAKIAEAGKKLTQRLDDLNWKDFNYTHNTKKDAKPLTAEEEAEREEIIRELPYFDKVTWFDYVRLQPDYKAIPDEVLFDINASTEFKRDYAGAWKYRTTRGSGMGKAAAAYAPEYFGTSIVARAKSPGDAVDLSKNVFLSRNEDGTFKYINPDYTLKPEAIQMMHQAQEKAAAQNYYNGMRLQSTSDARPEYITDYMLHFIEQMCIGSKEQGFTKVPEMAQLISDVGTGLNFSLIARGKGYEELTKEEYDKLDDEDKRDCVELDGKIYHALYSDVSGMNHKDAMALNDAYDNAQNIMVCLSPLHGRIMCALAARGRVTFNIPWHASGDDPRRFRSKTLTVGEIINDADKVDATDYQEDKDKKHMTDEERTARETMVAIKQGAKLTKPMIDLLMNAKKVGETAKYNVLRQMYMRFRGEDIDGSPAKIQNKFLRPEDRDTAGEGYGAVDHQCRIKQYDKSGNLIVDEAGDPVLKQITFSKDMAELIMPNDYWDNLTTLETADRNGDIFVRFADSLGYVPRFTGYAKGDTSKGKKNGGWDLYNEGRNTGYWTTLIDTAMYGRDGQRFFEDPVDASAINSKHVKPFAQRDANGHFDKGKYEKEGNKITVNGEEHVLTPMKQNPDINTPLMQHIIDKSVSDVNERRAQEEQEFVELVKKRNEKGARSKFPWKNVAPWIRQEWLNNPEFASRLGLSDKDVAEIENEEPAESEHEIAESSRKYSLVTDPEELARLNKEKTKKAFHSMQLIRMDDGKLYLFPPMAAVQRGKFVEGIPVSDDMKITPTWERSDENPDLAHRLTVGKNPKVVPEDAELEKHVVTKTTGKGKNAKTKEVVEWYWTDENGEKRQVRTEDNGDFKYYFGLYKGNTDDNGEPLTDLDHVAYDPYQHSTTSPLNDQFTTAYKRGHLVTVEVEIPESEFDGTSGYKADRAALAVGSHDWKGGNVAKDLEGQDARKVILSRWDKPFRIVPDAEVAAEIKGVFDRNNIKEMPFNVVTPKVREELQKLGVKIGKPTSDKAGQASIPAYEEWLKSQNPDGGPNGGGGGGVTPSEGERKYSLDLTERIIAGRNISADKAKAAKELLSHIEEKYKGLIIPATEVPSFLNALKDVAEITPEAIEFTEDNYNTLFGEGVITPIGTVKMSDGQKKKMQDKGRTGQMMLAQRTLSAPDFILEKPSNAKDGQVTERPSSYLFVKTFANEDGTQSTYYWSITAKKDGLEISMSNYPPEEKQVVRDLKNSKLTYINKVTLPSESNTSTQGDQLTNPVGDSSVGKVTANIPNDQTNSGKSARKNSNSVSEAEAIEELPESLDDFVEPAKNVVHIVGAEDDLTARGKAHNEIYGNKELIKARRDIDDFAKIEHGVIGDASAGAYIGEDGRPDPEKAPEISRGMNMYLNRYKDVLNKVYADGEKTSVRKAVFDNAIAEVDKALDFYKRFERGEEADHLGEGIRYSLEVGSPKQKRQTRSEEFKKWFGDWEKKPENASKVVDEKGEPLVVKHGTNHYGFTEFKDTETGTYFTSGGDNTADYYHGENEGSSNGTYDCYLDIKNPFVIDCNGRTYDKVSPEANGIKLPAEYKTGYWADTDGWAKYIKAHPELGYDGIIFKDVIDSEPERGAANSYVVFKPEQIKSATDNNGEFSRSNPDIRYSLEIPDEGVGNRMRRRRGESDDQFYERQALYKKGVTANAEEARKRVIDQIQTQIDNKKIGTMGKSDLRTLLTKVKDATPDNLEQVLHDAQFKLDELQSKVTTNTINKLLQFKVTGTNGRNMSVAKNVNEGTARVVRSIKKMIGDVYTSGLEEERRELIREQRALNKSIREAEARISAGASGDELTRLNEQLQSDRAALEVNAQNMKDVKMEIDMARAENRQVTAEEIELQLTNLAEKENKAATGEAEWTEADEEQKMAYYILRDRVSQISSEAQLNTLKQQHSVLELELQARQQKLAEAKTPEAKAEAQQQVDAKLNELRGNESMQDAALTEVNRHGQLVVDNLTQLLTEGKEKLQAKLEAERQRKGNIVLGVWQDFGKTPQAERELESQYDRKEQEKPKTKIEGAVKGVLSSFVYMAQHMPTAGAGKDSYFYRRFVLGDEGVMAAQNNYIEGLRKAQNELNGKFAEIFGKKWKKALKDNEKIVDETGIYVTRNVNGLDVSMETPMSKGSATYLYMVWKMPDGRAKMEAMGFDDYSMETIKEFIGEQNIRWADWVQDEFLVKLRDKYNETYRELFNTSMADIKNYVPLKIFSADRHQDVDVAQVNAPDTLNQKTGSLINRTFNLNPVDYTNSAYSVISEHIKNMEEWNAFARVRQDLNYVLSSTAIRNQLNENEAGLYDRLKKACQIATHTYDAKVPDASQWVNALTKGLAGSNIAFRNTTALKQMLSLPAFLGYSQDPVFVAMLGWNAIGEYGSMLPSYMATVLTAGAVGKKALQSISQDVRPSKTAQLALSDTMKWCVENVPSFRDRLAKGGAGNVVLDEMLSDKAGWRQRFVQKLGQYGMSANALVDASTCAIGMKTIYDYRNFVMRKRAKDAYKSGAYTEEQYQEALAQAHRQALREAEIFVNETQQSNHPAFLAPVQVDGDVASKMFTLYKNSPISYARKAILGLGDLKDTILHYGDTKQRLISQYIDEGYSPNAAETKAGMHMADNIVKSAAGAFVFGYLLNWLWNEGGKGIVGLMQPDDDDDDKESVVKYAELASPVFNAVPFVDFIMNTLQEKEMNPLLLFDLQNNFASDAKRYGWMSKEVAYDVLNSASRVCLGVDLNTTTNVYLAAEHMYKNGIGEGNEAKLLDYMFFMNTPNSNRKKVAREMYINDDLETFLTNVLMADKLLRDANDYHTYLPGMRLATQEQIDAIMKEYAEAHAEEWQKAARDQKKNNEVGNIIKQYNDREEIKSAFEKETDPERKLALGKAYVKALKKAQSIKDDDNEHYQEIFENMFPTEKDDEKVSADKAWMKYATMDDVMFDEEIKQEISQYKYINDTVSQMKLKQDSKALQEYVAEHKEEMQREKTLSAYQSAIGKLKKALIPVESDAEAQKYVDKIRELQKKAKTEFNK